MSAIGLPAHGRGTGWANVARLSLRREKGLHGSASLSGVAGLAGTPLIRAMSISLCDFLSIGVPMGPLGEPCGRKLLAGRRLVATVGH
jgi:hypothetical protein